MSEVTLVHSLFHFGRSLVRKLPQTACNVGDFREFLKFLRSSRTGGHMLVYNANTLGSFIILFSTIPI